MLPSLLFLLPAGSCVCCSNGTRKWRQCSAFLAGVRTQILLFHGAAAIAMSRNATPWRPAGRPSLHAFLPAKLLPNSPLNYRLRFPNSVRTHGCGRLLGPRTLSTLIPFFLPSVRPSFRPESLMNAVAANASRWWWALRERGEEC